MNPDHEWGVVEQLAALQADYLALLLWSKTEDGEKNRNRPKPIERPGIEPDRDVQKFGSDPVPIDELEDFLGWSKPIALPRDARGRFVKRS